MLINQIQSKRLGIAGWLKVELLTNDGNPTYEANAPIQQWAAFHPSAEPIGYASPHLFLLRHC